MIKLEQSIFKTASLIENILNPIFIDIYDITFNEFLILYKVYHDEDSSVADIQSDIKYKMDSASKKTKKLRDLGYIVKERRTDDERKVCIKLTDSGKDIVLTVLECQRNIYSHAEFTKEDSDTLFHLLHKYREAFKQHTHAFKK